MHDVARASGQPIHAVQYVAVFEPWSHSAHVLVFYPTTAELRACAASGTSAKLEEAFRSALAQTEFPFEEVPEVGMEFDSHENVVDNYEGSYFYRLR